MSFVKRLSIQATSLALVVSFVVPAGLLAEPREARAQAGTFAACVAAFTGSAAAQAPGAIQEVLGVPVSNIGRFVGDVFSGGSVNTNSLVACVLRPLGQAIVIALIRNIGSSVVNWVNSGFEGKPLFVTDFEGTLLNAADEAVGGFIEGTELGFLCSDFSFQIRLQLALKYSQPFRERVTCTLSEIGDNVDNFVENNGGAGWDNWLQITTQPNNSVYGAYFIAESELAQRAARAVGVKEKRVALGQGFLDFETCERMETTEEVNKRLATVTTGTGGIINGGGTFSTTVVRTDSTGATTTVENRAGSNVTANAQCLQKRVSTPGRVIADKLASVLGQGEIQSAVAQEIDAVIAATLNQIAQKAIQGASGLLGLSKKRSSSGPTYLDRYRAQFYGGALPASADVGASSELDDYRVGSIGEAQALFADSSDPNIRDINDAATAGISANTDRQGRQQTAIAGTYGATNSATVNAALLKPASQSSGTNPGGAIDGVTQTNQYVKGSATYNDDANPWWEVNLGASKKIKEVRVWKVSDKPGSESLGTFTVSARSDAGQPWTSAAIDGGQSANPIVVPVNQSASIVRISRNSEAASCYGAYERYDGEDCYAPLELAEVEVMEVIEATSVTGTSTQASSGSSGSSSSQPSSNTDPNSPVTVADRSVTASSGGTVSADVTVSSPANRSIGSLEVALESSTGQSLAFDQVFAQMTIGMKESGLTRNFQPGSNARLTFTGVSTGPSYNAHVILSGALKTQQAGSVYVVRVTAKDSAGKAISTGTVRITVASAI